MAAGSTGWLTGRLWVLPAESEWSVSEDKEGRKQSCWVSWPDGHGYSSSLSTRLNKSTDNSVTKALTQNRRMKMTDLLDQIDEGSIKYYWKRTYRYLRSFISSARLLNSDRGHFTWYFYWLFLLHDYSAWVPSAHTPAVLHRPLFVDWSVFLDVACVNELPYLGSISCWIWISKS